MLYVDFFPSIQGVYLLIKKMKGITVRKIQSTTTRLNRISSRIASISIPVNMGHVFSKNRLIGSCKHIIRRLFLPTHRMTFVSLGTILLRISQQTFK